MSDYYNAFEMSPVPAPGPDAVPPEPFRGIYGMPASVTNSVDGPRETPWNTRDLTVITPEKARRFHCGEALRSGQSGGAEP